MSIIIQKLKELVDAFKEMQEANRDNRATRLRISVGKARKEDFLVYLVNRIKNPEIRFFSFKDDNGKIPEIVITDNVGFIAGFQMNSIQMISSEIADTDNYGFNRYSFELHLGDKFDYSIEMNIDK